MRMNIEDFELTGGCTRAPIPRDRFPRTLHEAFGPYATWEKDNRTWAERHPVLASAIIFTVLLILWGSLVWR